MLSERKSPRTQKCRKWWLRHPRTQTLYPRIQSLLIPPLALVPTNIGVYLGQFFCPIISTFTVGHQHLFVFLLRPNNVREKTLWECWLIWSECVSVSNIAILPPLLSHYSMMDYAARSHKMRQQLDAMTRDQEVCGASRKSKKVIVLSLPY